MCAGDTGCVPGGRAIRSVGHVVCPGSGLGGHLLPPRGSLPHLQDTPQGQERQHHLLIRCAQNLMQYRIYFVAAAAATLCSYIHPLKLSIYIHDRETLFNTFYIDRYILTLTSYNIVPTHLPYVTWTYTYT